MKKQTGFTLIELVIVVVILGLLAVTAIPRFIDLTEQAKQANIEGMAGGFATAVSLVRAQWEGEGRTIEGGQNVVYYDGTRLMLTSEDTANGIRHGNVTGLTDGNSLGGGFGVGNCEEIWDNILQQPPRAAEFGNIADNTEYVVAKDGSDGTSSCIYYLKETLDKDSAGELQDPGVSTDVGNNFVYFPATGKVEININIIP